MAWRAMALGVVFIGSGPFYGGSGVGGQGGSPLAASAVEQRAAMPLGQEGREMVLGRATSLLDSSLSATHAGRSMESDASMG